MCTLYSIYGLTLKLLTDSAENLVSSA